MLLLWLKALPVQGRLSEMRVEVLLNQGFTTTSIAHSCKGQYFGCKTVLAAESRSKSEIKKIHMTRAET